MKILEPTATYVPQQNAIDHVAYCASVCYDSKPKTGKDAEKFVNGLVKAGHLSVLRHASHYYIVEDASQLLYEYLAHHDNNPYIDISPAYYRKKLVVANGQMLVENRRLAELLARHEVTSQQFASTEIGKDMMRYTFVLETQISTARELARHSPQNFTERSTRYIKGQEAIVRPMWLDSASSLSYSIYQRAVSEAFHTYNSLLKTCLRPEDARGILPLDTYTKVVMTHSISEWKRIIDMRVNGTTGRPHPNIAYLISLVQKQLNEMGYEL